jgi:hypothetical protein
MNIHILMCTYSYLGFGHAESEYDVGIFRLDLPFNRRTLTVEI